jgi:hypothetical protein
MPTLEELENGLKELDEHGFNYYTRRFLNPNSERRIQVRCRLERDILEIKNERILRQQEEESKERAIENISHILDIEDCQLEQQEQIKKLQTVLEQVTEIKKPKKIVVYNYNYNFYQYKVYTREHRIPGFHGSNAKKRLLIFNKNRAI